ncbi:MAG: S-layer homology domain-containing protein [Clostridiales bacterium]
MKKFVVVLLALAMVFGLASTAMAADTQAYYPDVADQKEAAQIAIYRLSALGVLEGYAEDGTFRPGANITRAEFAKVSDYLADKVGAISTFATMSSVFSDVKIGSWYNGYVISAYEYNLVNGYTDGTFGPQRNITLAEAVTMLLRVVGYTNELAGDWPYDYIAAAKDLGILDDIDFVSNRIATRAEVAILANAILELQKVQYDPNSISVIHTNVNSQIKDKYGFGNWDQNTHEDDYLGGIYTTVSNAKDFIPLGKDVLRSSFDSVLGVDFFYDAPEIYREGAAWGYEDFAKGELEMYLMDGVKGWTKEGVHLDVASKYYIYGGGLADLGGQTAEITYNIEDEEVLFVNLNGSVVKSYELKYDKNSIKADGTKYALADDNYIYEFDEDKLENLVLNDDSYGLVYLDKDGDWIGAKDYYVFADEEEYRFGIITDINANWIEFAETDEPLPNIALNEKYSAYLDDGFVFIKNGAIVAVKDLAVGDVVYQGMLSDGDVTYFLVYSPKESKVDKYRYGYYVKIADDREFTAHFGYYGETGVGGDLEHFTNVERLSDDAFKACDYAIAYAYDGLAYLAGEFETTATGVIVDAYNNSTSDSLVDSDTDVSNYKTLVMVEADGKEHEYKFDKNYSFVEMMEDMYNQDGDDVIDAGYEETSLGALVALTLDKDGEIAGVDLKVVYLGADNEIDVHVSGNYLTPTDAQGQVGPKLNLNDDAVIWDVCVDTLGNGRYDVDVNVVSAAKLLKHDFVTEQYDAYKLSSNQTAINGLYLASAISSYDVIDVALDNRQVSGNYTEIEALKNGVISVNDWELEDHDLPVLFDFKADADNNLKGHAKVIADKDGILESANITVHETEVGHGYLVGNDTAETVNTDKNLIRFADLGQNLAVTKDTIFYNLVKNKAMTIDDMYGFSTDLKDDHYYVYVYDDVDLELIAVVKVAHEMM